MSGAAIFHSESTFTHGVCCVLKANMSIKYAAFALIVLASAFQIANAAKVVEVSKDNRRMVGLTRGNQAPVKNAQANSGAQKSSTAAQVAKSVSGKR